MAVPQKTQSRATILSSNSTAVHVPEENKNTDLKTYMHPKFLATLFTIAKIQKHPKRPSTGE